MTDDELARLLRDALHDRRVQLRKAWHSNYDDGWYMTVFIPPSGCVISRCADNTHYGR